MISLKPYLYLGAVSAGAVVWGWTVWVAYGAGADAERATNTKVLNAIQKTRDEAQLGAADAIAQLKPQIQVINQKVRETVRVERIYGDCVHAPGVLDDINRALGGEPAGGGKLPPTDPAR